MTTIVDYGAGNIRSVENSLTNIGERSIVTADPELVCRAEKIILPGVGHFGQMLRRIDELDLRQPLIQTIRAGVPFLGICIGLQCLFEKSQEAPETNGLAIFPGLVKRFSGEGRVPHMGWNSVASAGPCRLMDGLADPTYMYFAHSYYAPLVTSTVGTTDYICPYTAILHDDNVYAVQFHPEKSGPAGLKVIQNFVNL